MTLNKDITGTMQEVYFDGAGGPDVCKIRHVKVPVPRAQQVLIKVKAAGINRPDCLQREGNYPPPKGETEVPGLEVAGIVVARGEKVTQLKIGDEVCALLGSGGYAQYCLAHEALCLPRPEGLTFAEAAAIPETYFTVYDNVLTRGQLKEGERFLVHGGSSGIGSTAIQLAKNHGATVYTTAGTDEKCDFCKNLGADVVINYKKQDFATVINQETRGEGVDVILDLVGGTYVQKNIDLLAMHGRLVQIAFLEGSKVHNLQLMRVMLKRLTITGSTLRSRSVEEKSIIARELYKNVWPLLEKGKIKPIIYKTFSIEEAKSAHALMESSSHMGKIILTMG
ncbi:MAG: NAD(P)H-quinone oxidoreductase [Cytophagaceae bacterium]|nr:NAD(P)H-quinone oxidoreductase [Cytophagaceae bacterium]